MKKWILMIVIVIALFGSAIGYNIYSLTQKISGFKNAPEPEYPVTIEEAGSSDWAPTIDAIGFIEPLQGVELTSQSSGMVSEISFESGMQVEEGQVLLELDSKVEKANLQSAQARLPAARSKSARYADLYKRNAVSKEAYDEARAAYLSLSADITALQANIERRTITAPFSGVVGLRNVYMGQFLQAGTDVVRLEDTTVMRLRFTVPQTDISLITIGQTINIFVDAYPDTEFTGKVSAIEPAVNAQSGLVQVQADIPNNDNKLRSGMFARANVVLPHIKDQVTLKQTAITYTLYGTSVYIVNEQTKEGEEAKEGEDKTELRVEQRVIKTGERQGDRVHILEGVQPGETVVTSGQVRLSNGVKVKVVESDATKTPETTPML